MNEYEKINEFEQVKRLLKQSPTLFAAIKGALTNLEGAIDVMKEAGKLNDLDLLVLSSGITTIKAGVELEKKICDETIDFMDRLVDVEEIPNESLS